MMLTQTNYRILQPVIYTCRIFGLCPVIFKKVGNQYQLKYSTLLVLYSYAVIIIFGIGMILGVRRDIEAGANSIRMRSSRTRYITLCDMAMVFTIALYGVITTPYRMKRFVRMLDIWSSVDKIIPLSDYRKYRKCSIIFVTGTILATTSLFLFDMFIYCMQLRISNNPTIYLENYISYYMLYFMFIFQEIYFWHMVFFIHIRIVTLNEHLSKEKYNLKNSSKMVFFVQHPPNTIKDIPSEETTQSYDKGSSGSNAFKTEKRSENTTTLGSSNHNNNIKLHMSLVLIMSSFLADRMEELMKIYGKVKDSVDILNDSASYGIVLLMLSCLLHMVVTPYFLLVEIFRKIPSVAFVALQGVWFLAHVGRLLIMVEPCQRCLKECKITNNLVSELGLMDFDKDTKKTLKNFASQFSYATISFDACGYFTIDRHLVTSVAGAVTTYLVILFQFNGDDGS